MTTEDDATREYVDQDGERPKLIKRMDDRLVANGYTREAAEREVDRIGVDVYNRAFNKENGSAERAVAGPEGIPGLRGERSRTTQDAGENCGGRGRVSKVFKKFDWPDGTRRRKWGILVDAIWFYDEPSTRTEFPGEPHNEHPDFDRECPPIRALDGKWWRRSEGRWLRLYMDRRMLWLGRLKFRIHTFHSGDDDSAPHTHPFNFVTLPLRSYTETVMERHDWGMFERSWRLRTQIVRAWRLHFRRSEHCHFVHEPARPFTTLVVAWQKKDDSWGFRLPDGSLVPYQTWTKYE